MLAPRRGSSRRWRGGALVAGLIGAAMMGVMVTAGAQPGSAADPGRAAVEPPIAHSAPAVVSIPSIRARDGGQRLFGLSSGGPQRGLRDALRLSQSLDHPLDLLNIYLNWPDRFPTSALQAIAREGITPEITWQPWRSEADGSHSGIALRAIADGQLDPFIRQWAVDAKSWARPLLLRFAHEMNADGVPWSAGAPGNTPRLYVEAYRHVVDVFRAAGATNVRWVWSPNISYRGSTPLAQVFPGRRYVDVVGLDGYNSGTAVAGGSWRTPEQVFGPTLAQVRSLAAGLPVLITETASSSDGGDKASWIRELFGYLRRQPDVVGLVWFNLATRADWPLDSSPAALAAARAELRDY
jgi:hypothetical protein